MSCAYFCHELVKFNMSTVNGYVIYMYVGCLNSSEIGDEVGSYLEKNIHIVILGLL